MLPVPENAKETAFVALFIVNALPDSITKSFPPPPVMVIALVVTALETKVSVVLLVTLNCPIEKLAKSSLMVNVPPGVVPAPSTINTSVVATAVLAVPVPAGSVFQLAAVPKAAPEVPTQ